MPLAVLHLQLAPVLAAEKSKVPFYIVGGALVLWALIVSLGLGLRKPNFPGSLGAQRAVIAVCVVIVAATNTTAGLTAGSPSNHAVITKGLKQEEPGAPVPSQPVVNASATSPASTSASSTTSAASSKEPPPGVSEGGHKLSIAANAEGQLAYNAKSLTASAGKVTITMTNMSPLEHNITIAKGSKVLGATPTFVGGTRTVSLTLKPGKYVFYCSVTGHRQAGMEGTLTVGS